MVTSQNTTHSIVDIRRDFPILAREVHGKPLVYLDSTASSQKPNAVIEAMTTYYQSYNANVHRGVYEISEEATAALEFIPISDDGLLRLDVYEQLLQQQPKLVAFTHMSNVLGTINPAQEMIALAHAAG